MNRVFVLLPIEVLWRLDKRDNTYATLHVKKKVYDKPETLRVKYTAMFVEQFLTKR